MARAFDASHRAYEAREGARAKELSNEGHVHKSEMERLNHEASEWILILFFQSFRLWHPMLNASTEPAENNLDSQPGEVDLHGLFVKEAIEFTDKMIVRARQRGDTEVHLIVGKYLLFAVRYCPSTLISLATRQLGLHSTSGHAKIKPAIEELMRKYE
jgi:hypothetical protein